VHTSSEPIDVSDDREDGRHTRRRRNRDTVVDALLELYREGNLQPSSDQVAERAGLSPRSLFRYFDDVDDLSRAAITRQHELLDHRAKLHLDVSLDLTQRIITFVEHRLDLFDAMSWVGTVTRLRAPFQPLIADELRDARAYLRKQLSTIFAPELRAMPSAERTSVLAAADALCSYESYHLLRDDQGLSRAKSGEAIAAALHRLLSGKDPS
jgi:TetR/AcrR family transcriptional regulator, regulator of autoinduction and epiphytic fitness